MYHRCVENCESSESAATGRILAIDFGRVRIGLAVSDALGITAQGLETLQHTNKQKDLRRLQQLIDDQGVTRVIVGHPLSYSGEETEMSRRVARFAEELRARIGLPVELWDERLSSLEAERSLQEAGLERRKRRQARDRVAAQIILQSYLDRRAYQRQQQGAPVAS